MIDYPRALITILPKRSGRDNSGHISARHHGGREKRYYRIIDFKRDKFGVPARVVSLEYDPNRNAPIAQVYYQDGEKRFILAPLGLKVGDWVESGPQVEVREGNALPLGKIPVGTVVHNIELAPGRGGILVRGAGGGARVLSRDEKYATLRLPSSEVRLVPAESLASVGAVGNADFKNRVLGKAGANRHRGRRPKVRGTAQNPRTHPHGGGEGRSGEGMHAKTPWGKTARGKRTRSRGKWSNRFIMERRKS